ncbi:EF-hand domain-containing protein [Streptomyces sp. DK15]|uniref:EF-hand domain-containing protein n=1 Tax=Streptomyces sp. DK15 TaxID=2957499 RepID=UPI0029A124E8|nr:EF-hand domain-containing protein [Streptomyces sp. DK15]MDX2393602.1 EF-hand domain-containing protein [Streptomyces sp. DK15]
MASVFQQDKIRAMFTAFDVDGDGCLQKKDFEALVGRWGQLPGVEAGTKLHARVESAVMGWWEHMLEAGDTNKDGKLSVEEFYALVDRLPAMKEGLAETADAIFDAIDADGNGRISRSEHRQLIDTWHGRSIDTEDVFDLLDLDADGHISRQEFAVLWTQFWISDDPTEPGNLVCGKIPAQELAG